jgi:hypothetical protein
VSCAGSAERGQDGGAGDPAVSGERENIAGVVIQPGQDLGAGPAGEGIAGEVGLPALAGQAGLEPDVRGLRALARLGVTSPARDRCRLIVAADTLTW